MPIDTENYASPSAYFALPERENREGSWITVHPDSPTKKNISNQKCDFLYLCPKIRRMFRGNNYLLFKTKAYIAPTQTVLSSYTSINLSIHSNYYIGFCGISKQKTRDKSYEYEIKILHTNRINQIRNGRNFHFTRRRRKKPAMDIPRTRRLLGL